MRRESDNVSYEKSPIAVSDLNSSGSGPEQLQQDIMGVGSIAEKAPNQDANGVAPRNDASSQLQISEIATIGASGALSKSTNQRKADVRRRTQIVENDP